METATKRRGPLVTQKNLENRKFIMAAAKFGRKKYRDFFEISHLSPSYSLNRWNLGIISFDLKSPIFLLFNSVFTFTWTNSKLKIYSYFETLYFTLPKILKSGFFRRRPEAPKTLTIIRKPRRWNTRNYIWFLALLAAAWKNNHLSSMCSFFA